MKYKTVSFMSVDLLGENKTYQGCVQNDAPKESGILLKKVTVRGGYGPPIEEIPLCFIPWHLVKGRVVICEKAKP